MLQFTLPTTPAFERLQFGPSKPDSSYSWRALSHASAIMDDVDALLEAAQGQLNSSLSNRDYGAALRSLERLKAAILGAEGVSLSEAEADDASVPSTSDWSETDDQARQSVALRPVASLSVQPDASVTTETALVVSQETEDVDFVSDAASLRKVLGLASGSNQSIALHRLGGALVLDAGVDDAWGDVDPETGEVIVCARPRALQQGRRRRRARYYWKTASTWSKKSGMRTTRACGATPWTVSNYY